MRLIPISELPEDLRKVVAEITIPDSVNPLESDFMVYATLDALRITAAVSVPYISKSRHKNAAYVYVYACIDGVWILSDCLGSQTEGFGNSISLSANGSTLAIGAERAEVDGIENAGVVHIYTRETGHWQFQAIIWPFDKGTSDVRRFGCSVQVSGDGETVIVAACGDLSRQWVYERQKDGSWK